MDGLPLFALSSLFVISQLFSLGSTLMGDVVVTKDSAESVRLKCHNTSATGPSGVQWNLSSEDLHIIERTSSGQILTGDNYTRSVALQGNGDLLLYLPSVSDSGIYTCVRFEANRTENYTSNVHLIVHPTASSADQLRSTIIVILLSIDVILIDANVILLLSHCQTYRKHKDIWSLRLFFLSYYIIYVTTGLLFLLLYVIGSKSEFLFNVGSTCSATSLPPVLILWIDFFVIVKRANRRRSQLKESALMEDMVPVIRTARYLTNGDRAGSAHRDNARLRKRYQIEDRPTKRSTCCSGQAEDDSGLETVELTGHRTHEIDRSPSQPTR